jgi:Glycosyl hydrolase family 99
MKAALSLHVATLWLVLLVASAADAQSLPVAKTNPTKVYMHYMPWFQTPASQGGTDGNSWGIHWTMANQNPNTVDPSGKRQIASHYYPMIGPYDSSDPNVLEYHMLLMKYSGIDGVMVDWYGVAGTNGDINSLLNASNAIVNKTGSFGIGAGVVLEDNFASNTANTSQAVANVQTNVNYLRDNYFNKPNYIKYGASNGPLLFNFGPQKLTQESEWTQVFSSAGVDPEFLTLNYNDGAGSNADGQFAWPYQDAGTTDHITSHLRPFYITKAGSLKASGKIAAGVAYPGFNDFYAQGGWGSNLFYIPETDPANGQTTLQETLNLYNVYQSNLSMLQLATFNDFGEGTQFEPTVEDGFKSLNQIQQYTGVSYGTAELQLIYQLYLARKKYAGKTAIQAMLDNVSNDLNSLDVSGARALLSQASLAGDYNGDGAVDMNDYNLWKSAFGSSTIIYGSGADGNYDGIINSADYTVWRDSMAGGGAGSSASTVPEPSPGILLLLASTVLQIGLWRYNNIVALWSRQDLSAAAQTWIVSLQPGQSILSARRSHGSIMRGGK